MPIATAAGPMAMMTTPEVRAPENADAGQLPSPGPSPRLRAQSLFDSPSGHTAFARLRSEAAREGPQVSLLGRIDALDQPSSPTERRAGQKRPNAPAPEQVKRLSASKMAELTESLPIRPDGPAVPVAPSTEIPHVCYRGNSTPFDGQTAPAAPRRHSYNQPRPSTAPDNTPAPAARAPSPVPPSIPLPPMSLPTILQLELAGHRPSPLYIHQSYTSGAQYESNAIKFERLKNFLLLPTYLERTMNFGALACLDAWLWTLTILPIRFFLALGVLVRWWAYLVGKETRWLIAFVWGGLGRMWQRGRGQPARRPSVATDDSTAANTAAKYPGRHGKDRPWGHRRTKSVPSNLATFHKADLLQGALVVCSCAALLRLDASRMYHFIRAQSAVKLYVIYNLIEVSDRLLSALGQDVVECLLSAETLSRNASGRSKVVLPLGMFVLALVYNVAHSIVLFYQVITLNVAVNSYSNALLSLLMSSQFVEVKSSVFKRTEKENTFQLACADIVERFQLWLVLFIIALRNIVEIGGLSVPGVAVDATKVPLHNTSILPASFTLLPSWIVSGEVLSPFLIVIGSEMVVDWIKHAYINKFNNIKPAFYGRILDILCKDYYTNAFVAPALTRRLGLPLLPLCTLFIRSSVQTYNMFLATHLPPPLPSSTQTSLTVNSATTSSPAMIASLERLDAIIRNALGRAVYGTSGVSEAVSGAASVVSARGFFWSSDNLIAAVMMVVVFFLAFLLLLMAKLLLGMALLRYARGRYVSMKLREQAEAAGVAEAESFDAAGRRTGGYGNVEVGQERRRWLFSDDPCGLQKVRDKERRETGKGKKETDLNTITRYEMIAKRIW